VILRYAHRALGSSADGARGFEDGDVRPDESEGDDLLVQRRALEDSLKDDFMLLEITRIAGEELAPDIRERAGRREVARVADGVTLVPGLDLAPHNVANGSRIRG